MTSKISGFVLSKEAVDYVPKINPHLNTKVIQGDWGVLTLFSAGEDIKPISPGVWSLGFPPQTDLLKHNLLITVKQDGVSIENDWIGSIPVYYNADDQVVSTYSKVCLKDDRTFDEEGLYLFLKYGFSVMGVTPFRKVRTLRYFSSLQFSSSSIKVLEKEDPALSVDLSKPSDEYEITELIRQDMGRLLDDTTQNIVCPLSGGLDSRYLCSLISDEQKDRVSTYTFGLSNRQEKSFEAQIARSVATRTGLRWKHIPLKNAYQHTIEWHDLFGFGIHLHGMNHIEFLKNILAEGQQDGSSMLLSGITGDHFTGDRLTGLKVNAPDQLFQLAYTHGLNCSSLLPYQETEAENKFFEQNRKLLTDGRWNPVVGVRLKMGILHYLSMLPDNMGMSSVSPFNNFEIVCKMRSLPPARLHDRLWVNDYFKKAGLHYRTRNFYGDTRNTLNRQLFSASKFHDLDPHFWQNTPIQPVQVEQVNHFFRNYSTPIERFKYFLSTQRVVKEAVKMVGLKNQFNSNLSIYQTLKSVEMSTLKY